MARLHGLEQVGFADKVMNHPAYDAFWQDQALDKILAKQGVTVPVMLVHSLWDQEDIYGNIALYKALKARQADNPRIFIWSSDPGFIISSGSTAVPSDRFDSAATRRDISACICCGRFSITICKDDRAAPWVDAGDRLRDRHQSLAGVCRPGRAVAPPDAASTLKSCTCRRAAICAWAASRPPARRADFEAYVSDPAKPVPYVPRPIHIGGDEGETNWQTWLVSDQRDAASRPDVLSFSTPVLTECP